MAEAKSSGVCPKCQMPLEKTGSGSLTQWIMVCRCSLPEAPSEQGEEQFGTIHICAACGKRIGAGREGTLTQWIFRADLCSCATPQVAVVPADEPDGNALEGSIYGSIEELSLERRTFPIERYAPLRLLGSGSAGSVYLCRDRLLGKMVAVKVLKVLTAEQKIAFQAEAKATSQLNHSNIVKVLDFGITESETPYMVLDYVEGVSLDKWIGSNGSLSLHDCIAIFDQICDALKYAHANGVFHRDLKPENIIVSHWSDRSEPQVKLIDFGVGEFMQELKNSKGREIVGTPAYMSPDQASGRPFDARSEIYTFGCVLFEALTGRVPFQAKTPLQLISMHAGAEIPRLASANRKIQFPAKLEQLVRTCLEKSPEKRYQNIGELKDALIDASYDLSIEPLDWQVAEPVPKEGKSIIPVLMVLTIVVCTVFGAVAYYRNMLSQQPIIQEKRLEDAPRLADAMTTIDADRWHIGKDPDGVDTWASSPNCADDDLKLLKEEKVEGINIGLTDNVTGVGLNELVGQPLRSFTIQSTSFNDDGLKAVARFKTLRVLRMSLCNKITKDGLAELVDLPGLEQINFHVMKVPEGAFEVVSKTRSLRMLSFYNAKNVTIEGLQQLGKLPSLSILNLNGVLLDHRVIPTVSSMQKLYELRMSGLQLSDTNLGLLAQLPSLTILDISKTPISDAGLLKLAKCASLKTLTVDGCKSITGKGLLKLKKLNPNIDISVIPNRPQAGMLDSLEVLDH